MYFILLFPAVALAVVLTFVFPQHWETQLNLGAIFTGTMLLGCFYNLFLALRVFGGYEIGESLHSKYCRAAAWLGVYKMGAMAVVALGFVFFTLWTHLGWDADASAVKLALLGAATLVVLGPLAAMLDKEHRRGKATEKLLHLRLTAQHHAHN